MDFYYEKVTDLLDWRKLRFLSCFIVLCSVSYHGYFHNKDHRCYANLLSNSLNDNSSDAQCVLKRYSQKESTFCLQNYTDKQSQKAITFIGDSIIQKLYSTLQNKVNEKRELSDLKSSRLSVTTVSSDYLVNFIPIVSPQLSLKHILKDLNQKRESLPSLIIFGFSYPSLKDVDPADVDILMKNISSVSFDLDLLAQEVPTLWILPRAQTAIQTVEEYNYIKNYKRKIKQVLKGTHIRIWDLSSISSDEAHQTQVILNLLCNKYEDGSAQLCCSSGQNYTRNVVILFFLFTLSLIILILGSHYASNIRDFLDAKTGVSLQYLSKINSGKTSSKSEEVELPLTTAKAPERACSCISTLILKSVLIFGYFYVCDRTDFFTKSRKSFAILEFTLPIAFCLIIGSTFRGKSSSDKLLNREITDEWKGWMQLIILIYHMTGASSILPIYMNIRILVSSYLFMTGYGNFYYYWQGGAMTFVRYWQVMLRMNLLTTVLCVIMQRPYQFYYFVPLVSFWFSVLYVTLLLPPKLSLNSEATKVIPSHRDTIYVLLKFHFLLVIIAGVNVYRKAFDFVFGFALWNFLFVLPGNGDNEWWFRWQLDRFSILYGAIFALIHSLMFPKRLYDEKPAKQPFILNTVLKFILGTAMVFSYSSILLFCRTKQQCNLIHPYIVFIPILGFILLRNVSETARGCYSKFFLVSGKISLELFICQYHVWLAADTKGRLVLIPGFPWLNLLLVSIVFTTIAYEVQDITGHVTQLLVAQGNIRTIRNLFFLFATVAICKYFVF